MTLTNSICNPISTWDPRHPYLIWVEGWYKGMIWKLSYHTLYIIHLLFLFWKIKLVHIFYPPNYLVYMYSKTFVKQPLSKTPKTGFQDQLSLNAGQVKSIAECSKGSILQYFWPSLSYHLSLRCCFVYFEWPFYTGLTVASNQTSNPMIVILSHHSWAGFNRFTSSKHIQSLGSYWQLKGRKRVLVIFTKVCDSLRVWTPSHYCSPKPYKSDWLATDYATWTGASWPNFNKSTATQMAFRYLLSGIK